MTRGGSPSLNLWRAELRAGKRSKLDFDPLWRAACLELESREYLEDGMPDWAEHGSRLAAAVVVVAAKRRRQGVAA